MTKETKTIAARITAAEDRIGQLQRGRNVVYYVSIGNFYREGTRESLVHFLIGHNYV